jgi:ribosomal protein S18 acetylase RimI-like enzyme
MMDQGRFQRSFSDDPTLLTRLFDLLDTAFPGLSQAAQQDPNLGPPWEAVSTPFVRFDRDIAVTHVGVLEIPFVLMGRPVMAGAIHAVCTRPEYRRRGYYRQVMEEALQYCDRRYDTVLLFTAQPELYEPFGFRELGEHVCITPWTAPGGTSGFRELNLYDPYDFHVLDRLLGIREPISHTVGIGPEKGLFGFNEGDRPLRYAVDLDVILHACSDMNTCSDQCQRSPPRILGGAIPTRHQSEADL